MDNIKMLIKSLTKYEVIDSDLPLLAYLKDAETQKILNDTHQPSLPSQLSYVVDYRTVGAFLTMKKEVILGSDAFEVVKSVKEGDTSVDLIGSSPEERYNALINWLSSKGETLCFRRLKW